MLLAWLARAQMLCAVGVLVWMACGLSAAARDGFVPARARYEPMPMDAAVVTEQMLKRLPGSGGRVLMLGEGEIEALMENLRQRGVEIRHLTTGSAPESAEGVDLICVAEARGEYLRLDYARLAPLVRAKVVFDLTSLVEEGPADAAGFEVVVPGRPQWPAWLDPEYAQFVAHVRARVPENAAILLAPSQTYSSALPRTRWFLNLNYDLAPRRLYLWKSELASGYVMQYYTWVEAMNALEPWAKSLRVRIKDRALTKLSGSESAPTRSLSPQELEAARQLGAEWVLLFTPNTNFRLVDWELLPVARVRAWSAGGN